MNNAATVTCQICNKRKVLKDILPAEMVRESVVDTIKKKYPKWSTKGYICYPDLNRFRIEHVQDVLETERGELSHLDKQVVRSLKKHDVLASNVNEEFEKKATVGQKLADGLTSFVGSWTFIVIFGIVLFSWVTVNTLLIWRPFDPFPFILLNLILSTVAAIQAPIIMMSQIRQSQKDSLRAEHDYKTDLKAELEIRHINSKIDQLMSHQWQRLLEIQRIQMELMGDHMNKESKKKSSGKKKNGK
ncbi:MAG TPA: DUF1003 domain-containing protein [Candidatus Nanoarchaeia archaeon]|nr:DUF1003 domain-containing protein [Candidatus Nanoarchaeia archaeon]